MKILHINSYFSTSGLFINLYDRQINDDLDIDVYVPISKEFSEARLASKGKYTNNSRIYNQRDRFIFPIKHRKILKDIIQNYDVSTYNLIHAHSLFSNGWLAYQLNQLYGVPYIVAVRNADIRTFFQKMPWMRKLGIEILLNAQQIIFISKNSYNEVFSKYIPRHLKKELQTKTQVVPNGIDDFWHNNIYHDKDCNLQKPLKIVSTGKVMGLKRFVQLSQMVEYYNKHYYPTELHIIGPEWDKKIVKKLKKSPVVTYYGAKTKEEICEIYRHMDIFALLSSPETFGLVYVEAMSQGLPVIYTKGEGFDSFFENFEIGVSVEKTDEQGFYSALDYIRNNYTQLSNKCTQQISPFNWDDIHQFYKNLYLEILEEDSHEKS